MGGGSGRGRRCAPQEARLWDTDSMLIGRMHHNHAWRFGVGCNDPPRGGGSEQPRQPWGDRHLICFQAVCAAGTFVSGLGLARVGKAGNSEAGGGDGWLGLRDGAARRWGAVSEVAVWGGGAAAGGVAAASAAWRPSRTFFLDSAGGGLRGVRRRGDGCGRGLRASSRGCPAA